MSDFTFYLDKNDWAMVQRKLNQLEDVDKRPVIQKALKDGAKDIINVGKTNLAARNKVRKGNLKGSFTNKLYKRTKGIYMGFKRPRGAASHLVDRGTAERYTKKGAYRGKIIGSMFWTDAVMSRQEDMMNNIVDDIINEIDKIVK